MQSFEPSLGSVIIYSKTDGPMEMYAADAREALARHPNEWALVPWNPVGLTEEQLAERQAQIAAARLDKADQIFLPVETIVAAQANRERLEDEGRRADEATRRAHDKNGATNASAETAA